MEENHEVLFLDLGEKLNLVLVDTIFNSDGSSTKYPLVDPSLFKVSDHMSKFKLYPHE